MSVAAAVAVASMSANDSAMADSAESTIRKPTSIAAQDLARALLLLAQEMDVQVVYRSELVDDRRTSGAVGELTVDEALTKLLSGTGLTYRYLEDRGITIVPLPPVSKADSTPQGGNASAGSPRSRWRRSTRTRFGISGRDCLVVAGLLVNCGPALSQNTQPSTGATLEEVTVTATRREENIRNVPISISAFITAQMDVQGMRSVDDIARLAPGIQFSRGGGLGTDLGNSISIRGIASGAGQATTGVYIDDTPIQAGAVVATGNITDNAYPRLFDIERVEVLRGPQGTLFGSGSEGGTIRFITPAPSLTTASAYVRSEVSTTQYGAPSYEIGAAGGLPIIEGTLGVRASVWNRRDGGYVDQVNYYTGQVAQKDNNWTDSTSARVALAWAPTEDLTITPSFFFQNVEANGSSSFFLPSDGVTGSIAPGGPLLPVFKQPYGDVGSGNYVDLRSPQWAKQRLLLPALKVNYSFANMELLSNTSYYERKQSGQTDFQFIEAGNFAGLLFPDPLWANNPSVDHQHNRFFTQELRLQSADKDARLRWVGGAYYSRTATGYNRYINAPYLGEMLAAGPVGNGCVPSNCVVQRFNQPLAFGQYAFINYAGLHETQKAVFGQVDFNMTDHLIATVGVRYAKLTSEFDGKRGGAAASVPFPTFQHSASDNSATTPKFMLSYKADDALIYASATKGFRGGGSNVPLTSRAACQESLRLIGLETTPSTYGPDSVWSYELGSKFSTAGGRVQIDASVFQIDWEDQIRNLRLQNCTQTFTYNIGSVRSRGFDFAVQWRATDALLLSLNGGYQEVKATETVRLGNGARNAVTEGDTLPGSQPSANAAAQYGFDMFDRLSYVRADVSYNGRSDRDFSFNPANSGYDEFQLFEDPSVTLANVRLGTHLSDWDVSLFVNNVFNEQPILGKNRGTLAPAGVPSGMLTATTVRPRTAGVTAILRF